jgi:VanZ family protein
MGQDNYWMKATIYGLRWAVLCLVVYWTALFIGTHIPASYLHQIRVSDKLLHALAFAGLAFLMAWAIPTRPNRILNVLLSALICTIYAGVDEILQIPVGRQADWYDYFADIIGTIMGLSIYTLGRSMIYAAGWRIFETEPTTARGRAE